MSDITEEEKSTFQNICELEKEDLSCITYEPNIFDESIFDLGTAHLTNILQWAKGVNYLRKILIDVDGLIEAGLAIDSTTLK